MSFFISAAHAAEQTAGEAAAKGGGLSTMLLFAVIFLLFYMLMIRPQNKRAKAHRTMVQGLNKGDEVITSGGILGTITSVDDDYLSVEIANNVPIRLQKACVTASLPKGTCKAIQA